jgi:hypothetical protein
MMRAATSGRHFFRFENEKILKLKSSYHCVCGLVVQLGIRHTNV